MNALYFNFHGFSRKALSLSFLAKDDAANGKLLEALSSLGLKATLFYDSNTLPSASTVQIAKVGGHAFALTSHENTAAFENTVGAPVLCYLATDSAPDSALCSLEVRKAPPPCNDIFPCLTFDPTKQIAVEVSPSDPSALSHLTGFGSGSAWGGILLRVNLFFSDWTLDDPALLKLFELLASFRADDIKTSVWPCTLPELVFALKSFEHCQTSMDGTLVSNPSECMIYARYGVDHGEQAALLTIPAGATLKLTEDSLSTESAPARPENAVCVSNPFADNWQLAYPGFLRKALTFSYDDAPIHDRRLLSVLDAHGLRGTFNINTGSLPLTETPVPREGDTRARISVTELKELYANHEVAVHGEKHETWNATPCLTTLNDVSVNRDRLEKAVGYPVRGSAYPCGPHSDCLHSFNVFQACQIAYSRTCYSNRNINYLPKSLYWDPTAHHDDSQLFPIIEKFLSEEPGSTPFLLYIWGHSFEFDGKKNWERLDEIADKLGGHEDSVWYATNIEIFDYLSAYHSLLWSCDRTSVYNPSAQSVFFLVDGVQVTLPPGLTVIKKQTP